MKSSLRITSIYFIISALWITFSDYLVEDTDFRLFDVVSVQTLKGYFFILMTSVLIYYLVDRLEMKQQEALNQRLNKERELEEISHINARYKHVMEQITQGIVLINPNKPHHPVIFMNRAAESLTGFNETDMFGREYLKMHQVPMPELEQQRLNEAIKDQQPYATILPNVKKDGTFYWQAIKMSPIFSATSQLENYLVIQEDVTDQTEQQRLIENQLDMFEAIIRVREEHQLLEYLIDRVRHHLEGEVVFLRLTEPSHTLRFYSKNVKKPTREFFDAQPLDGRFMTYLSEDKQVIHAQKVTIKEVDPIFNQQLGYRSMYSVPVYSEAKEVYGILIVLVCDDVTTLSILDSAVLSYTSLFAIAMQKLRFMQQITESERVYRLISEHSTDMIVLINEKEGIDYISPAAEKFFGELPHMYRLLMQLPARYRDQFESFLRLVKNTKESDTLELDVHHPLDGDMTMEVNAAVFFDHDDLEEKLLLNIRDISERKTFEQALNRSLYFDPLTQLPNRFYFKQKLKDRLKSHLATSLVMISFDEINHIQHAYGEDTMTFILKELSDLMSPYSFIQLFSRTGESEFSFIVNTNEQEKLDEYIQTVIKAIEEPWHLNEKDVITTISVGVSISQDQSIDQLMIEAEMALKEAQLDDEVKTHYYHPDQREQSKRQLQLKNDLYYASDYQEFELFYQPIVDVREERLYGFESLLRWKHPSYGYVSPTEFIPIAEQSGRIVQIGYWVMEKACQQLKLWEDSGLEAVVSVNISYRQIIEEDFVERVKTIINHCGCHRHHLVFELTENILMKDIALSNRVLNELKAIGIRISVDDFGIGYSSLSYIKKFPIDILKIDRAFVRNLDEETNDLAIIRAIVEMSRSLNLRVVIEGVETEAQLKLLKQLRCQLIQGYLFSKPLPPKEVVKQIAGIQQHLEGIS
ncbi:EAL domain-containing protein [Halolactibacillus sp. JCM 19043]|uniref:bifunctional diguanylate cyclase/phosphodiesterase n=1 Tax=Halolactibacillus sp. JCM 19043 TaxID=1460638 RepID=UPI0007831A19|nr:EAL domain-containing protein [Halolactibacillus sp. JCM 19043]